MKVVSTDKMRELDAETINEHDTPGEILMERAGQGVADIVDDLARVSGFNTAPVRLFAGKGNNGGDVFVAARLLHELEYRVDIWLAAGRGKVTGDALKHLERMRAAGLSLQEASTPADWDDLLASPLGETGIVVDGILGTGISGPARGAAAGAIQYINALGRRAPVVAVDVPSGLNSDTGEATGDTVRADVTVTMGMPKRGLLEPRALDYVGSIDVVDIGIPQELIDPIVSDIELIAAEDLRRLIPRRARVSHKGDYGHLLIVGGAPGFAGAAILAAHAAIRSGVGLVSLLVPEAIAGLVASAVPEAMVHAGRQTDGGSLAADALERWPRDVTGFDAIVAGPGMTTHDASRGFVDNLLSRWQGPLLLDADALTVLGGRLEAVKAGRAATLLTPHPGEMGRLLATDAGAVQSDRFEAVRRAIAASGACVVLKGAGTLVGAPGERLHVNMTGNPGMAKGGMGDTLAGLMGGLLAQGYKPFDAARIAVYVHGRAGDRVAWSASQAGMTAGDVCEACASVFGELSPR